MRWALVFAAVATLSALAMWGFTVDDALISIRYARHLAAGVGYRFNPAGPSTDGVTPLPWPFLIAPLARAPAMTVLVRVKAMDLLLHAGAGALLGRCASRTNRIAALTALAAVAVCLPLAAWGASGMETPLATLLGTMCVFCMESPWAPVFAGLAAAVRPELLPWATAASCGLALARRARPGGVIGATLVAAAPFAACALARRVAFGHFAPLAVLAKPSDPTHGAVYAIAGLAACGLPVFLLAPRALVKIPPAHRALAVAFGVHVLAIVLAGGDSMPYARLFVPVLPSVLAIHMQIAHISRGPLFWLRTCAAVGLAAWVFASAGPRGRHVMSEREDLIGRARPVLAGAKTIAAVDVGWVSACADVAIVDLAGLTDPDIAALPGGHTSKRVSGAMLLDRHVDAIVLWTTALPDEWGHVVAARLARDPLVREHYSVAAELPLGSTGAGYVVFRPAARASPDAPSR
ncbi:MAG TPA: hypothetical protein VGH28_05110 [Polyangiaceae bacterium]